MAYSPWTGLSFTFNSQALTAYVRATSGTSVHALMQEFQPLGSAWPTPVDTGSRTHDPYVVEFMADGSATGPNVKCALGTSSTLTEVLDTGQSDSGTYIVTDVEYGVGPDQLAILTVTFTPTGTQTLDITA